ncbi:MAG: DUF45 domain-containing protein [Actinomycetota bacterium]|nr:DUF45 domain-containing protein [Actinomycetota bacterium]
MADDRRAPRTTLPPYTVRRSARARHVRLVVSGRDGLVVVVPARFDLGRVPALVAERAEWIERSFRRIGGPGEPASGGVLPDAVDLRALDERWHVVTAPAAGRRAGVTEEDGRLVVALPHPWPPPVPAPVRGGPVVAPARARHGTTDGAGGGTEAVGLELLRAWLNGRARSALEPWLRHLAAVEQLSVGRVSIRSQRTRWASCSAQGNVSLNRSLLFLPPDLVAHVLRHELAHRCELNHSPRFYARLAAMDPQAAAHAAALRTAWRLVPAWAG